MCIGGNSSLDQHDDGPGSSSLPVARLRESRPGQRVRPEEQRAQRPAGGRDDQRPRPRILAHHTRQGGAHILRDPVREAADRSPSFQEAVADRAVARRAERHRVAQQLLPGEVRVLPRVPRRGDVEPKHQHLRGLPVPEHLGVGEVPPEAQGLRGAEQRRQERPATSRVDLRRRFHERHRHVGRVRRGHHGSHQQRDHRLDAVQSRGIRVPLSEQAFHQQRGSTRQHGPVGPGAGPQMAEGQRRRVRRRSRADHHIRRVGRGQLGLPALDLAGHTRLGTPWYPPERNLERAVELHDRREGERSGQDTGRRLWLQLDHAAGEPRQSDGLYEVRGREDYIRSAVEQLLGHPRLPVRSHHRWNLPAQASAGSPEGGRLQGHGDSHREQRERG